MGTKTKWYRSKTFWSLCAVVLIFFLLHCFSNSCLCVNKCGIILLMPLVLLAVICLIVYFIFDYFKHQDNHTFECEKLKEQKNVKEEERKNEDNMLKNRIIQRLFENEHKKEDRTYEDNMLKNQIVQKLVENALEIEIKKAEAKVLRFNLANKLVEEISKTQAQDSNAQRDKYRVLALLACLIFKDGDDGLMKKPD